MTNLSLIFTIINLVGIIILVILNILNSRAITALSTKIDADMKNVLVTEDE